MDNEIIFHLLLIWIIPLCFFEDKYEPAVSLVLSRHPTIVLQLSKFNDEVRVCVCICVTPALPALLTLPCYTSLVLSSSFCTAPPYRPHFTCDCFLFYVILSTSLTLPYTSLHCPALLFIPHPHLPTPLLPTVHSLQGGRQVVDIASPRCKKTIQQMIYIFRRHVHVQTLRRVCVNICLFVSVYISWCVCKFHYMGMFAYLYMCVLAYKKSREI
jgi:hypothetical protein